MIRADTPASAPELGAGLVIADDPCWELVPRPGHISISATIFAYCKRHRVGLPAGVERACWSFLPGPRHPMPKVLHPLNCTINHYQEQYIHSMRCRTRFCHSDHIV